MRRLAAAAFAVAALLVLLGAAIYFLREERPAPAPTPEAPAPPKERKGNRRGGRPPPREAPAPAPAPPTAPAPVPPDKDPDDPDDPDEDAISDDWRRYPADAKGPVVVGIVSQYGDPDPDCWVALESVEEPSRPDPSVLESLSAGRFRLTGFAAGRYRVRARMDDTPAAYSKPFDAKDGEVVDAGHLRLLRRGCVSGLLRDAAGTETDADVRLFGRDPATLKPRIVEDVPCAGRQGFQFAPHEAGEFLFAATGKGGWLVHRGKTDAEGIAWVDVPLKPWSTLEADLAKAPGGAAEAKDLRFVLEPVEVPDVGVPAAPRTQAAPARFERLLPGKYRLRAEWQEASGTGLLGRRVEKPIEVREGGAEKATLDR
jgi:hypothetical protein